MHLQFVEPMLVAVVLGALIGLEREIHGHPAGLRTHILVCLGSTIAAMVSTEISRGDGDPGRVASQVVTGIGFLGAGAIIRDGANIRGLTTAASIWTTAMIGLAAGASARTVTLAAIATAIVLLVLWWLHHIEGAIATRGGKVHIIEVVTEDRQTIVASIAQCVAEHPAAISAFELHRDRVGEHRCLRLNVRVDRKARINELMAAIGQIEGVQSVSLP